MGNPNNLLSSPAEMQYFVFCPICKRTIDSRLESIEDHCSSEHHKKPPENLPMFAEVLGYRKCVGCGQYVAEEKLLFHFKKHHQIRKQSIAEAEKEVMLFWEQAEDSFNIEVFADKVAMNSSNVRKKTVTKSHQVQENVSRRVQNGENSKFKQNDSEKPYSNNSNESKGKGYFWNPDTNTLDTREFVPPSPQYSIPKNLSKKKEIRVYHSAPKVSRIGQFEKQSTESSKLTEEQKNIVCHPLGKHARVLAVAGSGKTTTMVHRVMHLIVDCGINPNQIQVLMFNRLARKQFQDKLSENGIPDSMQPAVNTFHSISGKVMQKLIHRKLHPRYQSWTDDKSELARIETHKVIQRLEKQMVVKDGELDVDEALHLISLWKNSLIKPDVAGCTGNHGYIRVYKDFELIRRTQSAITYDDFIPLTVDYLSQYPQICKEMFGKIKFLIVDEYQDVNYGQERLIELIAGKHADVMIVGDDDQTIYEWRGARPDFITTGFYNVFCNKEITTYKLTNSFRFGPLIAQSAFNTISNNKNRVRKDVVAFNSQKKSQVDVLFEDDCDPNREIAIEIQNLINHKKEAVREIVVLSRLYAQLASLETVFLKRKIPYYVRGNKPFFERTEVKKLLNYLLVAYNFNKKLSADIKSAFISIVNTPNRFLPKDKIGEMLQSAEWQQLSLLEAFDKWGDRFSSSLNEQQFENFISLKTILRLTHDDLQNNFKRPLYKVLEVIITTQDFKKHYESYYGQGEESFERIEVLNSFIQYVKEIDKSYLSFLQHVKDLDSKQGLPEEKCVMFSTVYRVKGLEYEHVFIPNCVQGTMPFLPKENTRVFDVSGVIPSPRNSNVLETERRLFYVGLTRAKSSVVIGTGKKMGEKVEVSKFIDEMDLKLTKVSSDLLLKTLKLPDNNQLRSKFVNQLKALPLNNEVRKIFLHKYLGIEFNPEEVETGLTQRKNPSPHMQKEFDKEKYYLCPYCNEVIPKNQFSTHQKLCKGKNVHPTKSNGKEETLNHALKCKVCHAEFQTAVELITHYETQHLKV